MRQSREAELLEFLSLRREGFTWRELLGKHVWSVSHVWTGEIEKGQTEWSRQTLDRLLKTLIQKGLVERILESRKEAERGRQCSRYRIPQKFWNSWGCLVERWPCRWIGSTFFLGTERTKVSGKKYVRLFPEEYKRYREHKKSLK
jgi:hypothetical protein